MNKDWKNIGAVTLVSCRGDNVPFNSLTDFVISRWWFVSASNLVDFPITGLSEFSINWNGNKYNLLDEVGLVIPRWRIYDEYNANKPKRKSDPTWWYRSYLGPDYFDGGCNFRNGPVPGIHKPWRGGGWRHPKTHQETVRNSWDTHTRGKRNYLPTDWDDIYPSASRDRSWKRHRKTQYKPIEE